jgi:hypothetical protein
MTSKFKVRTSEFKATLVFMMMMMISMTNGDDLEIQMTVLCDGTHDARLSEESELP